MTESAKDEAPKRIWLQRGQADDPAECTLSHVSTDGNGVEYIRATAKEDLISRRGVVERLRAVASRPYESGDLFDEGYAAAANALADEFAAADSVEMRTTTRVITPVVEENQNESQ